VKQKTYKCLFCLTKMKKNTEKSNFFDSVYQLVKQIPKGRATSYGAIAEFLGAKGSARMVGYAMNAAHQLPDVPAHRVVNRLGLLTGRHHFQPPELMQQLLEQEGVIVVDDQIQHWDIIFWHPRELL